MPGSSLWLTPPPSHPLHGILTTLIEATLPALFANKPDDDSDANDANATASSRPPVFAPHLTLTSNIDPAVYGSDPQQWLDSLPFALPSPSPASQAVAFERVRSEDVFFRRCYIKCSFTDAVRHLAGVARAWGVHGDGKIAGDAVVLGVQTEKWLGEWKVAFGPHVSLMYGDMPIDQVNLNEVEQAVQAAGISLKPSGARGLTGWEGGVIWLVSTEKSISQWHPIATRTL